MGTVDYYALFGVERTASRRDIKSAYRALAKAMHPDIGGTASDFHALTEAYQALTDPRRRAEYDRSWSHRGQQRRSANWPTVRRRAGQAGRLRDFGEDAGFVPPTPTIEPTTLPWWPATHPALYLPPAGPTRERLAAALGALLALLLLAIWLPIDSVPLRLGLWALVIAAAAAVARLVRRRLLVERAERAFVTQAGGRAVFGQPGSDPDQLAERLTARLLADYLLRLPGTRVFHGLTLPGSVFADVDHAILRGRKLMLVESKLWLPGHYAADRSGAIFRNAHPFRGGNVRLADALPAYRDLLPDIEIRGALVIYPSRTGEITVGQSVDAPIPPMTANQFVHQLGTWLADESVAVDPNAFGLVRAQLSDDA